MRRGPLACVNTDLWGKSPVTDLRSRPSAGLLPRVLLIESWAAGAIIAGMFWIGYARHGGIGEDAHAYWLAGQTSHPYGAAPGTMDAYLYSPLFAQVMHPLAVLPFAWFASLVIAIDVAAIAWLLRPLGWRWAIPILLALSPEFVLGQVIGLLTVTAVLGLTGRAGWWAFGWLTKITPGAMGTFWHGARGEWHRVVVAFTWTAALFGVSYLTWPEGWHEWIAFLLTSPGSLLVTLRAIAALVLVAIGARRRWWWVMPVALFVSAPTIGVQNVAYFAGLVRLHPTRRALTTDTESTPALAFE
jgi:hypothetical protein